jgi:hypothetical protein
MDQSGLREAEDRAAAENITLQREAGIGIFTDGEVRRTNYMTGILESTGGMTEIGSPPVNWRRDDGVVPPTAETDFVLTVANAKVFRKDKLTNVEAEFMASQVPGQFKITMMGAAMGGMVWRPEVSMGAHPEVIVGMHVCRGNNRSAYMAKGYEPVAERLFGEVPVDRFLLKYDTGRAGGFASTVAGNVLTVDQERRKLELVDTAQKVWG